MPRIAALLPVAALAALAPPAASARAAVMTGPAGVPVEITKPNGTSHGTVLIFHGGGWTFVGAKMLRTEERTVRLVRRAGWTAVNADYRAGRESVADVLKTYAWARRRFGRTKPICSAGSSSGGHLALLLAAFRPAVRCTIGIAAPTDLAALETQSPHLFAWGAEPAFGDDLGKWSPLTYATRIRARVVLATGEDDTNVPKAQQEAYVRADRDARGFILRRGEARFVHGRVSITDRKRLHRHVVGLLARVARRPA